MNLGTPYRGTFRRVPAGQFPNDVVLEIPILFTRVGTGPSGLVDVVAVKLELGGTPYALSRDLTLHALSRVPKEGDGGGSLLGETIRRRPASFQPDADDNNAIVAALHAMPAGNGAGPLPQGGEVPMVLHLHLLFTNMAPLPIEIRGTIHPASGLVTLEPRPKRVTSPVLTNANLIALGVLCTLLLGWHSFLNEDVYEQTRFAQQMVPALLGALVTFLGLSIGKIKGWLATLVDTLSVLEYPELHFNPELTKRLGTRWFSAGVGLLTVGTVTLVGWHWSVEASLETPELAIYDTLKGKLVENDRIYRSEMRKDPDRFGVVCVDQKSGEPADKPFLLAYRRPGTADVVVDFQVRDLFAGDVPDASKMTGEATQWLADPDLGGSWRPLIREVLCGPSFTEARLIHGTVVKPVETGETLHKVFELSSERIWTASEISDGPIRDVKKRLRPLTFSQLFARRNALVTEVETDLREFFASGDFGRVESAVPRDEIVALSNSLLSEVQGRKPQEKAVERSILIRGLWRASADRHEQDAEDAQLLGLATSVRRLLERGIGWKAERALFDLLLELQCQHETAESLHAAAVAPWAEMVNKERYPKLLDYLVATLAMDAMKEPQQSFFIAEWEGLRTWGGPDADFGTKLAERERRFRAPDRSIAFDRVLQRLGEFETQLRFDGHAKGTTTGSPLASEPARSP